MSRLSSRYIQRSSGIVDNLIDHNINLAENQELFYTNLIQNDINLRNFSYVNIN